MDLVGRTLGKYRIVAKLGRGGMAEVYKAYQPGLNRYVAVKVMHSYLADDKDFLGRFEREALATGKLRHPNIVQAQDFDNENNIYFMVMEFIDGPTLKDEFRARKKINQPFTLKEIALIFSSLCEAIDYAHDRNMVHRDLKPANVMINEEGYILLTDFGIARLMGGTQYTATGAMAGTPAYMSPEQGQGQHGDKRSDIYSLGIMLYEMVTGTVPYEADTPIGVVMKHVNEPLPLPTKTVPTLPKSVEAVILKAMSKKPDDRYQSAGDMATALREAVGVKPSENLRKTPLKILAVRPEIKELDPNTDIFTPVSVIATNFGATVVSARSEHTPVQQTIVPPAPPTHSGFSWLTIGLGILAMVIVVFFAFRFGTKQAEQPPTAIVVVTEQKDGATATAEWLKQDDDRDGLTNEQESQLGTLSLKLDTDEDGLSDGEEFDKYKTDPLKPDTDGDGLKDGVEVSRGLDPLNVDTDGDAIPDAKDPEPGQAATPTPTQIPTALPATDMPTATNTPIATDTPTTLPPTNTFTPAPPTHTFTPAPPTNSPTPVPPTETPTSEKPAISGKLAFPVDNGAGQYDVQIVSLPDGNIIGKISGARQPNFRADGLKLLVNGQGGAFGENVFEASSNGAIEHPVSDSPSDLHPFYNPQGDRVVYGNPQLVSGSNGKYNPYIFVQCTVNPPSRESDVSCKELATMGILVPEGLMGDIIGSNPVWTGDDQIAYKGCNTWRGGGGSCGVFLVPSWATKRTGSGITPRKLVDGGNALLTDAKGSSIVYQNLDSYSTWEVFVTNTAGGVGVNISNSPSNDGLGTLSPDGQWVAFASDREGTWAIFIAPATGGPAQKLLAFPKPNPWAVGDRDWTTERMSWGK